MISCMLECYAMLYDAMQGQAKDANQEQPESPEEPRGVKRRKEEPRGA